MKKRLKEAAIIIIFMSFLINMPVSVGTFYKYLASPKSSLEYEQLEESLEAFSMFFLPAAIFFPAANIYNNNLMSILAITTIILAITVGHILGQFIIKEKIKFKGGKFPIFPFNIIALICFLGLVLITLLSETIAEFFVVPFIGSVMLSVGMYIKIIISPIEMEIDDLVNVIVNPLENWYSLSWLMKLPVIIISFLFYCISVFSFCAVPAIVIFTLAYLAAGYFHSFRNRDVKSNNEMDKKEVTKVEFLFRDIDKIISVFSLIALVTSTWILISKGDVAHPAWGVVYIALFFFSFAFPYYLGKKIGALIKKQTLAKLSEISSGRSISNFMFFSCGVGIAALISFILGELGVPPDLPYLPLSKTWFPIPEVPIIVNSIVAFAVGYSFTALYLKTYKDNA
ncbi:hypothetical protein M1M88_00995 [Peptococcaceae bacterium]|nr:hypothetical protein [Peptococcaceae bacterium]MCL0052026.1 hypothetical protein [Peptococcaceae bacterium]